MASDPLETKTEGVAGLAPAVEPVPAAGPVPASTPNPAAAPAPARAPTLSCSFAQMRPKVGEQIHLELLRRLTKERSTVTILGWLEGQSVIVSAPQNDTIRLMLQEGEPVQFRAFTGQNAFAFRATVIKAASRPFHYLHLSFPDKVESVAIRSSPRCRLRVPVKITVGSAAPSEGAIVNIGTNGALIETPATLGKDAGPIQVAFSLELHGVPVELNLRAEVCGEKGAPSGENLLHQYGVEFRDLKPNDRLILGSLVCYQMFEHPQSVA
jgi:hypothetical protein